MQSRILKNPKYDNMIVLIMHCHAIATKDINNRDCSNLEDISLAKNRSSSGYIYCHILASSSLNQSDRLLLLEYPLEPR